MGRLLNGSSRRLSRTGPLGVGPTKETHLNFLLHRHLAIRDLGSATAGLGAMLPDLWRMADRRMRARASVSARALTGDPCIDQKVFDLARGVDHHLEADHWFHRHPAFLEGEAQTRTLFTAESVKADRMGLLAHVGWELCLDGALLRREGATQMVAQVRATIEQCRGEPLRRLRQWHRPPFAEDWQSSADFDSRLEQMLDQLAYGSWIEGYAVGSGLIDRLSGVRRRVGLKSFDKADHEKLAAIAEHLISEAAPALTQLEEFHSTKTAGPPKKESR